jgi:hypothetical protein
MAKTRVTLESIKRSIDHLATQYIADSVRLSDRDHRGQPCPTCRRPQANKLAHQELTEPGDGPDLCWGGCDTRIKRGLYPKYAVTKTDGTAVNPKADYFVLRLDTDAYARDVMWIYAGLIGNDNPQLAEDLRRKVTGYLSKKTT